MSVFDLEYPFMVYLNANGTIGFRKDFEKYDEYKLTKIDVWVVNNRSQFEEIGKLHRLYLQNNSVIKIKKAKIHDLKRGTQIVYLPTHLQNNAELSNTDIQFGFVTSMKNPGAVFCRYFSKYDLSLLRTLSCSEQANISDVYLLNTFENKVVKYWINYIDQQEEAYKKLIEEGDPLWLRRTPR